MLKCRKRVDGCVYAVKRIERPAWGEKKRKEMLREVFVCSILDQLGSSPSLVRYYDAWVERGGDEDGVMYIQFEFARGGNVAKRIAARKGVDVLKLCLQVAQGLAHMHRHRLAHLDIKPDNILVCPTTEEGEEGKEREDPNFKLCDFGLAAMFDEEAVGEGDRRYLPADALREDVQKDKVDMYALGMTIYEAESGQLPSDEEMGRIRAGNPTRLYRCDDFIMELIVGLLHPDPEQRPSADEVVRRIERHRMGRENERLRRELDEAWRELEAWRRGEKRR